MKKLIIIIVFLTSGICCGQTVTSTITVADTNVYVTTQTVIETDTSFTYVPETIYKTSKFDDEKEESERIYQINKDGILVTFTQEQLEETIRILNARKLKGENVNKELIINTERLKKLKILQK